MLLNQFICELFYHKIIKFGNFTLRNGETSRVYVDLRSLISYPPLMKHLSNFYMEKMNIPSYRNVVICGVPYSGIPTATIISHTFDIPMLMVRKEQKEHGTKKIIEGEYDRNTVVILLDDVYTTGVSLAECKKILMDGGIQEKNINMYVFLNRSQKAELPDNIQYVTNLDTCMSVLNRYIHCEVKKSIVSISNHKNSRLVLAADVDTYDKLIDLVEQTKEYVSIVKIHSDIIKNYNPFDFYERSMSDNFLIMDDRKFCDIGNTVEKQYIDVFKYCHMVTVHGVMGASTLQGIKKVLNDHDMLHKRFVFLVAQASTEGNLMTETYTQEIVGLAKNNADVVCGFISQRKLHQNFLHMTPGINLRLSNDDLGQSYKKTADTDFIIVGRGIYERPREDWNKVAMQYSGIIKK